MKPVDVDPATELTFLHCLHDEREDDPRVLAMRRRWYEGARRNGLRSKVLRLDGGEVVALSQSMPIERTHFEGRNLLAILCIWVHGYAHHVGNQQGRGYGRLMLEAIEEDARASGFDGVAAWGMDFPYWNPVSFYEHMGYSRVDRDGAAVLVWKPFTDAARPPRFMRPARRPEGDGRKVSLFAFGSGSCMGACEQVIAARDAVKGLESIVDYREIDTGDPEALREWGVSGGVFLDGEPHRPNEAPPTSEVLRADLIEAARRKGLDSGRAPARVAPRLDREELSRRAEHMFGSFYLTLIGVIQSVVLSYLVLRGIAAVGQHGWKPLPYLAIGFVAISLVTLEYSTLVAGYRWYPGLPDVMIPLGFGVAGFLSAHTVDRPALWWCVSTLSYVGACLAYANTRRHVTRDHFEAGPGGDAVFSLLLRRWTRTILLCAGGGAYCIAAAVVTRWMTGGWLTPWSAFHGGPAFWTVQGFLVALLVVSLVPLARGGHSSFVRTWSMLSPRR